MPPARTPLAERFWPKVDKQGPDDCWIWTGARGAAGYGKICIGGRSGPLIEAHRAAYVFSHGAIPDGLHIHHHCRNRLCVNPRHLEAMTPAENVRLSKDKNVKKRTHCPHGHPYAGDNLYVSKKGAYMCRECGRTRSREDARLRRARQREAA